MTNKIQDIVNTLTEEEKELHKDIIAECLEREKDLESIKTETNKNLSKFLSELGKIFEFVNIIYTEFKKQSDGGILNTIPDEKYFKC